MVKPALAVVLISLAAHAAGDEAAYRLTVKGDDPEGSHRAALRAEFCLAPVRPAKAEVCLGAMKGYELSGVGGGVSRFTLAPGQDEHCVCETPVTLEGGKPLCWPEWIEVGDLRGRRVELTGFVTLLEGAHEPGDTAASCVQVDSDNVVLLVKRRKPQI